MLDFIGGSSVQQEILGRSIKHSTVENCENHQDYDYSLSIFNSYIVLFKEL